MKIENAWVDSNTYLEYDLIRCDVSLTDGKESILLMILDDPDDNEIKAMKNSGDLFMNILKEIANGKLVLEKF